MRRPRALPLLLFAALANNSARALTPPPSLLRQCAADALGGCCGGLAKALAVYPLDRAATRREVGRARGGGGGGEDAAGSWTEKYRGAGVVGFSSSTLQGMRGLRESVSKQEARSVVVNRGPERNRTRGQTLAT